VTYGETSEHIQFACHITPSAIPNSNQKEILSGGTDLGLWAAKPQSRKAEWGLSTRGQAAGWERAPMSSSTAPGVSKANPGTRKAQFVTAALT